MLITLLVAGCLAQAASPLDAFQSNYHSIKAKCAFEYYQGQSEPAIAAHMWEHGNKECQVDPSESTIGTWACDGTSEYYFMGAPSDVLRARKDDGKRKNSLRTFVPEIEILHDADLFIRRHTDIKDPYHNTNDRTRYHVADDVLMFFGAGPFFFRLGKPFPQYIAQTFPNLKPKLIESTCNGHPVIVEIYERKDQHGPNSNRLEVSYDPAIGFLPRFVRELTTGLDRKNQESTAVLEMYLMDARPCQAGGFVPTEWYTMFYVVVDFKKVYPEYNQETQVRPTDKFRLGHFKATNFANLNSPVALTKLDGVKHLTYQMQFIELPRQTRSLTMAGINRILRRRTDGGQSQGLPHGAPSGGAANPRPNGLPSFVAEEAREFPDRSTESRDSRLLFIVGGVCMFALCCLYFARRRAKRLKTLVLLVVGTFPLAGCSGSRTPVIVLSGRLTTSSILYEPFTQSLKSTLVVRNEGNVPLKLMSANGGCSCRKIENTRWPMVLRD